MERLERLVAVPAALIATVIFASALAAAQPAAQGACQNCPRVRSSMMAGGMNMGGGTGMGCMGGMGAIQIIQKDPKLMARMMELQGEMMRLMSDAMIQRSKELQKSR
jgi:hypothetical protein